MLKQKVESELYPTNNFRQIIEISHGIMNNLEKERSGIHRRKWIYTDRENFQWKSLTLRWRGL